MKEEETGRETSVPGGRRQDGGRRERRHGDDGGGARRTRARCVSARARDLDTCPIRKENLVYEVDLISVR